MSQAVTYSGKLIVLRGNSGSGKSTVARMVQQASSRKIALVEQDYLRRIVLKEKEAAGGDNIDLIFQVVTFALSRGYDVVLDGMLVFARYGEMLGKLATLCPDHHFFYFDVSLEETLRRHATKPITHVVGEHQVRELYRERDVTSFADEKLIPESSSLEDTVELIVRLTGLR